MVNYRFYLYTAIHQHSPNSFLFIMIIGIYCHFSCCGEVVRITARLGRKASRALQVFWAYLEGQCCCQRKDSAAELPIVTGQLKPPFRFPSFLEVGALLVVAETLEDWGLEIPQLHLLKREGAPLPLQLIQTQKAQQRWEKWSVMNHCWTWQ